MAASVCNAAVFIATVLHATVPHANVLHAIVLYREARPNADHPDRKRRSLPSYGPLRLQGCRGPLAGRLGRRQLFRRSRKPGPAQILRAGNVSLSVGAHPHGPRAQLHDGRRRGALQAGARLQRAAPDGLGRVRHARRKRRDGKEGPPRGMDLRQYRHHAPPAQTDGAVDRLEPRDRDLPSGLLPPRTEDVSRFRGGRADLPARRLGQLGPCGPDRAGQRTGDRRLRLAVGRAGRKTPAVAMVLPHHRLRPGPAGRAGQPGPLARKSAPDAGQLDRPVGRAADFVRDGKPRRPAGGLHHPAGHHFRRQLLPKRSVSIPVCA